MPQKKEGMLLTIVICQRQYWGCRHVHTVPRGWDIEWSWGCGLVMILLLLSMILLLLMTGMRGSRSEAEQGLACVATRGGKKEVRKGERKTKERKGSG